jgi:hypothetical protein
MEFYHGPYCVLHKRGRKRKGREGEKLREENKLSHPNLNNKFLIKFV